MGEDFDWGADRERQFARWREAEASGLIITVQVLGPTTPRCGVADALRGMPFTLNGAPILPLKCTRMIGCECVYLAEAKEPPRH
jgi:hypothetical protein